MNLNPSLYKLHLTAGQFPLQHLTQRDSQHHIEVVVSDMNMGVVMFVRIKNIHRDENSVEHA